MGMVVGGDGSRRRVGYINGGDETGFLLCSTTLGPVGEILFVYYTEARSVSTDLNDCFQ
jgi:hypothetical protein